MWILQYNTLFFILFFIVLLSVGLYTIIFIVEIIASFSDNLGPPKSLENKRFVV